MHGRKVIVQRQRLEQRIVFAKSGASRLDEAFDHAATLVTALAAAMAVAAEGYVLIAFAQAAGRTMIVVAITD